MKLAHLKTKIKLSEGKKLSMGLSKITEEISPLNEDDIAAVNSVRQSASSIALNTNQRKRKLPFGDRMFQNGAFFKASFPLF